MKRTRNQRTRSFISIIVLCTQYRKFTPPLMSLQNNQYIISDIIQLKSSESSCCIITNNNFTVNRLTRPTRRSVNPLTPDGRNYAHRKYQSDSQLQVGCLTSFVPLSLKLYKDSKHNQIVRSVTVIASTRRSSSGTQTPPNDNPIQSQPDKVETEITILYRE